jgi:hypothetical protein
MANDATTAVKVGFNQQQRQLIERLKAEGTFGKTDGEVIRAAFAKWLIDEGSLSK